MAEQGRYIITSYKALGTEWTIEVFDTVTAEEAQKCASFVVDFLENFNLRYSRFRDDSLLNVLNYTKKVPYDDDLFKMLTFGENLRSISEGIFDLGIKKTLEAKGYGHTEGTASSVQDERTTELDRVSTDGVTIFSHTDAQFDLGGIGKGYAIDAIVSHLREKFHLTHFIVNGGGDLYVATPDSLQETIYLEHPYHEGESIGTVLLENESLCVSSSFKRTWKHHGVTKNHFINPTNDQQLIVSASYVIADTTVLADTLATTLAVSAGSMEKVELLAKRCKVECLVINEEGEMYATERFCHVLH
jgi:thiamine biosynthesis lipoprotein